jgi:hypothetical protein
MEPSFLAPFQTSVDFLFPRNPAKNARRPRMPYTTTTEMRMLMGVRSCSSASRNKVRRNRQSLHATHRPPNQHSPDTVPLAELHFDTVWNATIPTNQPTTSRVSVLPKLNRLFRCSITLRSPSRTQSLRQPAHIREHFQNLHDVSAGGS